MKKLDLLRDKKKLLLVLLVFLVSAPNISLFYIVIRFAN